MRISTINKAAVILGMIVALGGIVNLVFPIDMVVFHHDIETSRVDIERVTPRVMEVYGIFGITIGALLIWYSLSPMRRKAGAIESYVWALSQDLKRRFGERQYYTTEQVSHAAQSGKFRTMFISYAHAMFSDRDTFNACYKSLGEGSHYDKLRAVVSRRYLNGAMNFNGATIVRMASALYDDESSFS